MILNDSFLINFIDGIPYPIQVYAPDGTSVMVNKAMLKDFNLDCPDKIVGKYNLFKDATVIKEGLIPYAKRTFKGETFTIADIKVPLEDINLRYGVKDSDIEAMYLDITMFPVYDNKGKVIYAAVMFINKHIYRGKKEIEKAKKYIEMHCLEDFNINEVAKAAYHSPTHLTRLFKKHTGTTPYEYYTTCKFIKLQKKLLDLNLSVAQAFNACGLDYNGHFAKIFKEKTGYSPSEYRKQHFN